MVEDSDVTDDVGALTSVSVDERSSTSSTNVTNVSVAQSDSDDADKSTLSGCSGPVHLGSS